MNIHFLADSVYSQKFIKYVNENFANDEHLFVVFCNSELKYIDNSVNNVKVYKIFSLFNSIKIIKQVLKNTKPNKIFLHYLSDLHLMPILLSSKKIQKYWIVWGGDIYNYIDFELYDSETKKVICYQKKKKTFKEKILLYLRKVSIKKLNYIAINEAEFRIIKKNFYTNAQRVLFKYPNPVNDLEEEIKNIKSNGCKKILLGNSGEPSNNHLEIIDKLANLNCNFDVIVPLSYGQNKKYIDYVLEYGKNKLGEHFHPLLDFMKAEDYSKLLSTVDVAIMNHYRQQGAGNLRILLNNGKKVYLNSINPLFEYYSSEGIFLSKIDDCKFDESIFIEYSQEIKVRNKENINKIYSQDNIFSYMNNIFK